MGCEQNKTSQSSSPSIFLSPFQFLYPGVCWSLFQLPTGGRQGTPCKSPVHHRAFSHLLVIVFKVSLKHWTAVHPKISIQNVVSLPLLINTEEAYWQTFFFLYFPIIYISLILKRETMHWYMHCCAYLAIGCFRLSLTAVMLSRQSRHVQILFLFNIWLLTVTITWVLVKNNLRIFCSWS